MVACRHRVGRPVAAGGVVGVSGGAMRLTGGACPKADAPPSPAIASPCMAPPCLVRKIPMFVAWWFLGARAAIRIHPYHSLPSLAHSFRPRQRSLSLSLSSVASASERTSMTRRPWRTSAHIHLGSEPLPAWRRRSADAAGPTNGTARGEIACGEIAGGQWSHDRASEVAAGVARRGRHRRLGGAQSPRRAGGRAVNEAGGGPLQMRQTHAPLPPPPFSSQSAPRRGGGLP